MRIRGGNLVRALKVFKSSAPIIPGRPNQPHNLHSSITSSLISDYLRSYSTPTGTLCFIVLCVKLWSICRHLKTFENSRSAAAEAATSAVGRPR